MEGTEQGNSAPLQKALPTQSGLEQPSSVTPGHTVKDSDSLKETQIEMRISAWEQRYQCLSPMPGRGSHNPLPFLPCPSLSKNLKPFLEEAVR